MAEFIKQSWVFPVIQSVHLIGLTMLVGSICLVDLRLLGVGRMLDGARHRRLCIRSCAMDKTRPADGTGDGPLMFGSDLTRYMNNPAFLLKMGLLAVALAGQFHAASSCCTRCQARSPPSRQKMAAVLSLIVWSSIVLAGRAIADFDIRIV